MDGVQGQLSCGTGQALQGRNEKRVSMAPERNLNLQHFGLPCIRNADAYETAVIAPAAATCPRSSSKSWTALVRFRPDGGRWALL